MKLRCLLLIIFISNFSSAQVIPSSQRADWSNAGISGNIAEPSDIVDVKSFGAKGDGMTNDYNSIQGAINSLNGASGVVFFSAGVYLVKSPLNLPSNIILRGESSEVSKLKFNLSSSGYDCIKIGNAQSSTFTPVNSGYTKESTSLTLTSTTEFQVGDYAEIRQKNGSWDIDPKSYATYCVGQIVKISGITGNSLTIENPLRIDYSSSLNPEIRKITPVKNTGIEFLTIERENDATPSSGGGYNISFLYAANCWVKAVESNKSVGAHILADGSTNLEVTGCYFHDAFTYDGTSTRGYGVTLIQHTGQCLIENNIFRHLRHAMMVKQGANGNVFGYNYSIEPNRSETFSDYGGDISLHGHYAFGNLFEGNIVQNIHIDQTGGPAGPYNTFFRNRASLYGIWMTAGAVQSDRQNFVGNEVMLLKSCAFNYNGLCYIYKGNYETAGSGHFEYANTLRDNSNLGVIYPSGASDLNDKSYYKVNGIELSVDQSNSAIGAPSPLGTATNDAEERYLSTSIKTYPDPYTSLPVDLENFYAIEDGHKTVVSWTTTREINNHYFILEKSNDGKKFNPLQQLEGNGNSDFENVYTITDKESRNGTIYYRLKQVDYNGGFSYSQIISLNIGSKSQVLEIFPNPIKDFIVTFSLIGLEKGENLIVSIFDSSGKRQYEERISMNGSEGVFSLNLNNKLNKGIYFMQIKSASKNLRKPFLVK
jgi:hypothetical protein